jgi:hypothetical protein
MENQSFPDFIATLLDYRKSKNADWPELLGMWDRLKAIAKEIESAGLVRASDNDSVLFHWDFSSSNIMIKKVAVLPDPDSQAVTDSEKKEGARISNRCQHKYQLKVGDAEVLGAKHTFEVQLESPSDKGCKHSVEVVINDNSGKTYRHMLDITDAQEPRTVAKKTESDPPAQGSTCHAFARQRRPQLVIKRY